MSQNITPKDVRSVARFTRLLADEGVISVATERAMIAHLMHIAKTGEQMPTIMPRLIDQREASAMLGIGLSNFKKLEKDNAFPFKRKMVGSAVRYRVTDIAFFILSDESQSN